MLNSPGLSSIRLATLNKTTNDKVDQGSHAHILNDDRFTTNYIEKDFTTENNKGSS